MTTIAATTYSRQFSKPRATHRTVLRPGYLKRLRFFIEHSAWEERILAQEARVDKFCIGVIIAAVLCLAPIVIKIFLR